MISLGDTRLSAWQPQATLPGAGLGRIDTTDSQIGLSDYFRRYHEPHLRDQNRSAETLSEYRRHVARWDKWAAKDRIGYPVLAISAISRADLADWRSWLRGSLRLSPRSANKHVGSVQAILAGAADRGTLPFAPRIKPLETDSGGDKPYLTYEQVDALYEAAGAATWPTVGRDGERLPFRPADYWRAFLVLKFCYGPRTQELWSFQSDHSALTWRQVSFEAASPAADGVAENRAGWFFYVPQKQRLKKPRPLVLPLCELAALHLRAIRPPGPQARERVFPAPWSSDSFYDTWRDIVAASGVQLKPDLETGERPPLTPKVLRRTCETWHDTHAPGLGEIVTGHAERSVSGRFYAHRERRLVKAMKEFPLPDSFARIRAGQRQRTFF